MAIPKNELQDSLDSLEVFEATFQVRIK